MRKQLIEHNSCEAYVQLIVSYDTNGYTDTVETSKQKSYGLLQGRLSYRATAQANKSCNRDNVGKESYLHLSKLPVMRSIKMPTLFGCRTGSCTFSIYDTMPWCRNWARRLASALISSWWSSKGHLQAIGPRDAVLAPSTRPSIPDPNFVNPTKFCSSGLSKNCSQNSRAQHHGLFLSVSIECNKFTVLVLLMQNLLMQKSSRRLQKNRDSYADVHSVASDAMSLQSHAVQAVCIR